MEMSSQSTTSRSFASDNFAGVHPAVMENLQAANLGHAIAYGGDVFTDEAVNQFERIFGVGTQAFFVFGGTDVEIRESVRSITEKEKDAIIVASYGTFSTGVNIRNLHNIVFASPSKSRIRNLQSIGRGLRIGENKEKAVLFDISDDFRIGKHANYTLQHFIERVKIYDDEKFNYKFYNIDLKT